MSLPPSPIEDPPSTAITAPMIARGSAAHEAMAAVDRIVGHPHGIGIAGCAQTAERAREEQERCRTGTERYDDHLFRIRSWNITLTALLLATYFGVNVQGAPTTPPSLAIAIYTLISLCFWWLDALNKSLQTVHIKNSQTIESFLRGTSAYYIGPSISIRFFRKQKRHFVAAMKNLSDESIYPFYLFPWLIFTTVILANASWSNVCFGEECTLPPPRRIVAGILIAVFTGLFVLSKRWSCRPEQWGKYWMRPHAKLRSDELRKVREPWKLWTVGFDAGTLDKAVRGSLLDTNDLEDAKAAALAQGLSGENVALCAAGFAVGAGLAHTDPVTSDGDGMDQAKEAATKPVGPFNSAGAIIIHPFRIGPFVADFAAGTDLLFFDRIKIYDAPEYWRERARLIERFGYTVHMMHWESAAQAKFWFPRRFRKAADTEKLAEPTQVILPIAQKIDILVRLISPFWPLMVRRPIPLDPSIVRLFEPAIADPVRSEKARTEVPAGCNSGNRQ